MVFSKIWSIIFTTFKNNLFEFEIRTPKQAVKMSPSNLFGWEKACEIIIAFAQTVEQGRR